MQDRGGLSNCGGIGANIDSNVESCIEADRCGDVTLVTYFDYEFSEKLTERGKSKINLSIYYLS